MLLASGLIIFLAFANAMPPLRQPRREIPVDILRMKRADRPLAESGPLDQLDIEEDHFYLPKSEIGRLTDDDHAEAASRGETLRTSSGKGDDGDPGRFQEEHGHSKTGNYEFRNPDGSLLTESQMESAGDASLFWADPRRMNKHYDKYQHDYWMGRWGPDFRKSSGK